MVEDDTVSPPSQCMELNVHQTERSSSTKQRIRIVLGTKPYFSTGNPTFISMPFKMDNSNRKLTNYKKRQWSEIIVADDNNTLNHQMEQWLQQEEGALMVYALSFLDVKTLLQKETVSKTWRKLCKTTLRNKCCGRPKAFQSNLELKQAVWKYFLYGARSTEEIACTYGYPVDSWDVSQITDMSFLFLKMRTFNEYIGSWNVSNVTNMNSMFSGATAFNQEIGSWDVQM
jgi:hypothetical protein